jgi:hydroxymethylglutaryl-CoA reductase (NADPH)
MSGVNNNGAHSANGITALFIATGHDAANVGESSAAFFFAERRDKVRRFAEIVAATVLCGEAVPGLGSRGRGVGGGSRPVRAQPTLGPEA